MQPRDRPEQELDSLGVFKSRQPPIAVPRRYDPVTMRGAHSVRDMNGTTGSVMGNFQRVVAPEVWIRQSDCAPLRLLHIGTQ